MAQAAYASGLSDLSIVILGWDDFSYRTVDGKLLVCAMD